MGADTDSSLLEQFQGFQKELADSSTSFRKEFDELREFNAIEIKLLTEENEKLKMDLANSTSKSEETANFEEEMKKMKLDFEMKEKELQANYEEREKTLKKEFEEKERGLKSSIEGREQELSNEVDMCENATAIAMEELKQHSEKNKELTAKLQETEATVSKLKTQLDEEQSKVQSLETKVAEMKEQSTSHALGVEVKLQDTTKLLKSLEFETIPSMESKYNELLSKMENEKKTSSEEIKELELKCSEQSNALVRLQQELSIKNDKLKAATEMVSSAEKQFSSDEVDMLMQRIEKLERSEKESLSTIAYLQQDILNKFHDLESASLASSEADNKVKEERQLMLKFFANK